MVRFCQHPGCSKYREEGHEYCSECEQYFKRKEIYMEMPKMQTGTKPPEQTHIKIGQRKYELRCNCNDDWTLRTYENIAGIFSEPCPNCEMYYWIRIKED